MGPGLQMLIAGVRDRRDRKERNKDREEDRKDRREEREARNRDREEARALRRAQMRMQGIVFEDDAEEAVAESGSDFVDAVPEARAGVDLPPGTQPFNPNAGIVNKPRFPQDEEGFDHYAGLPQATLPQAPVAKPKPAGSFDPAIGGFTRAQRIPLGGGMWYDPSIAAAQAELKNKAELSMFEEKEKIKNKYGEPKRYQPTTREEWMRDQEFEAGLKKKNEKGGGGGKGGGSEDDAGEVTAGDKRREDMANSFARRHLDQFGGRIYDALKYVESNPKLKAEAVKYGVTLSHWNGQVVQRQKDLGDNSELPQLGAHPQSRAAKQSIKGAVTGAAAQRPVTAPSAPKAPPPKEALRADKIATAVQVGQQIKATAPQIDEQVKLGRLTAAEAAVVKQKLGLR